MYLIKTIFLFLLFLCLGACDEQAQNKVILTHGTDESAGGGPAYIITTPSAVYFLEKQVEVSQV